MKNILATLAGLVIVGLLITAFIMGAEGSDTAQGQISRVGTDMVDALTDIP